MNSELPCASLWLVFPSYILYVFWTDISSALHFTARATAKTNAKTKQQ